jgi:hypothetical protein
MPIMAGLGIGTRGYGQFGKGIVSWIATTLASSTSWNVMGYKSGIFVAIGGSSDSNVAQSSTDGITWTARTMPLSLRWQSIATDDSRFVVTPRHQGPPNNTTAIAYSDNGTTWTQASVPSARWYGIGYGNGLWVITPLASDTNSSTNIYATSTNGTSWTERTISRQVARKNVAYGNAIWVMGGGSSYYWTSTNGTSWTERTWTVTSEEGLAFVNGQFIAPPNGSTAYWTSTNGTSWTQRTGPASGYGRVGGDGTTIKLVTDVSSNFAYSSTDGITWTAELLPSTGNWSAIAAGGGKFVTVSRNTTNAAYLGA